MSAILSLQPHPSTSPAPSSVNGPPSSRSPFATSPSWSVTTHVFPAAYPRQRVGGAVPLSTFKVNSTAAKGSQKKAGKLSKAELDRSTDELFERQARAEERTEESLKQDVDEVGLWIAVNRYYKTDAPSTGSSVTMIACHATGLHKETWEPTFESFVRYNPDLVTEIWALDSVHQGESAILNEGRIGNTADWTDFGRDVANFVAHYLPPISSSTPPYLLPFQPLPSGLFNLAPSPPTPSPLVQHRSRTLIGVGHSLGGASLAVAASLLPTLFHSLFFVDVVMFGPKSKDADQWKPIVGIAKGALSRKDFWSGGRAEALAEFEKKKMFYGLWDSRVLERFVKYALSDTEDGGVELRCPKAWEAMVFADPQRRGSYSNFLRLAYLSPLVSVHWVFAQRSILPPIGQEELVKQAAQCHRADTILIEGSTHLVAQEKPGVLGRKMAKALEGDLGGKKKL